MKIINWVGGICTVISLTISLIEKDYSESLAWGCIVLFYFKDMVVKK